MAKLWRRFLASDQNDDRFVIVRALALFLLVLACFAGSAACGKSSLHGATYAERQSCSVEVAIPNMACAEKCPVAVRGALARVEGVQEVDVDFGARSARVAANWPACGNDGYGEMLDNLGELGYQGQIVSAD